MALALVLCLDSAPAAAQWVGTGRGNDGLVIHVGEPAYVETDRQAVALAVLGADARIDGTVRNTLLVVDGRAEVSGAVHGDIVVVDGRSRSGRAP